MSKAVASFVFPTTACFAAVANPLRVKPRRTAEDNIGGAEVAPSFSPHQINCFDPLCDNGWRRSRARRVLRGLPCVGLGRTPPGTVPRKLRWRGRADTLVHNRYTQRRKNGEVKHLRSLNFIKDLCRNFLPFGSVPSRRPSTPRPGQRDCYVCRDVGTLGQ